MNRKFLLGAAGVALLGVGALARSQGEKPTGEEPVPSAGRAAMSAKVGAPCHKASDVIGAKVHDAQRAELGKVEDLVVDPTTGQIDFAVLSLAARGDGKGQWFAVPFQALAVPTASESGKPAATDPRSAGEQGGKKAVAAPEFQLNVDASKLASAPGFVMGKWPEIASPDWRMEIERHYGIAAQSAPLRSGDVIAAVHAARVSELLERAVYTTDGARLGEIEELAIDLANARISYFVAGTGAFLGVGDKLHAIPWEAVRSAPGDKATEGNLVVSITKERLLNAPEFKREDWARMSERTWVDGLYGYYGFAPYRSAGSDKSARDARSGTPPPAKSKERSEQRENDPH